MIDDLADHRRIKTKRREHRRGEFKGDNGLHSVSMDAFGGGKT